MVVLQPMLISVVPLESISVVANVAFWLAPALLIPATTLNTAKTKTVNAVIELSRAASALLSYLLFPGIRRGFACFPMIPMNLIVRYRGCPTITQQRQIASYLVIAIVNSIDVSGIEKKCTAHNMTVMWAKLCRKGISLSEIVGLVPGQAAKVAAI